MKNLYTIPVFTNHHSKLLLRFGSSRIKILLSFLAIACSLAIGQNRWVTGYYPTWWYGTLAPSAFEMSSLTHLIIFPAQDALSTSPYFNAGDMDDGNNMQSLITIAHTKGVKVVASITGGYGQTNMPVVAADAAKCSTFVVTACAWAKARNFDGIELDWEFPRSTDSKGWNQLIRLLRIELNKWTPKGILMTSANYISPSSPPYYKDSMAVFDQINLMSYTMWMGPTQEGPYKSGYDTPVNMPTQFSGYSGTSLASGGPAGWIAAGYPASQIGIGIPFESTIFSGVSTMGQSYSSWQFGSVATQSIGSGYPSVPSSGRQYDATAQAAWCVSGGKVYAYQDTNSVKAIISWAKNNNFGGIMVWDFPAGHDNAATPKDNLLRVVARETKASNVSITGSLTASPQSLPVTGGNVTLTWTSQNATAASIDQGIGTVGLNSSTTVNVTSTKTFCLTLTNGSTSIICTSAVTVAIPLPVQLTSFIGTVQGRKVELAWKTATEVNSNMFEIERRSLAQWERIGEIPAAGTSNTPHEYTYVDNPNYAGTENILYRLKTINNDGSFQYSAEIEVAPVPMTFSLEQNYPNPFNPETKIQYSLSENANVQLRVYDIMGREVAELTNEEQKAGYYERTFKSMNLSSGVYFYRVTAQSQGKNMFTQMKKMILVK
jgi:GH18 family chitinase